jgi:hypothetical protein
MSTLADFQARLVVKEGDDVRSFSNTLSDRVVTEDVFHQFTLAATAVYTLSLGGIGTHSGLKGIYLETDKRILFDSTSVSMRGAIPANGFYFALLTATTHLYIKPAATTTATITVAVVKL